jgi:hypothetical protein
MVTNYKMANMVNMKNMVNFNNQRKLLKKVLNQNLGEAQAERRY